MLGHLYSDIYGRTDFQMLLPPPDQNLSDKVIYSHLYLSSNKYLVKADDMLGSGKQAGC